MKLGRMQSKVDPRTLMLADYVHAELPKPPVHELLEITPVWPMLANDRFNCCTSAAAGHMVHHWTAANHEDVVLSDDDIIRAHALLTRDHLLECVSMLDALKLWRNTGIGNHRIHSFVQARPSDADQLKTIIHLFGAGYVGLDLPHFACGPHPTQWPTTPWSIPPQAAPQDCLPVSENGHCVTAIGYGDDGIYVVTWGLLKVMSWEFYERFNFETYAILSHDWVDEDKKCPTGFYSSSLVRDLKAVELAAAPATS